MRPLEEQGLVAVSFSPNHPRVFELFFPKAPADDVEAASPMCFDLIYYNPSKCQLEGVDVSSLKILASAIWVQVAEVGSSPQKDFR